ncbi:adhesin [Actinoplanes sp. NEAU-A12]|uniref:Adhesin n=1 Tax=Actinoplanes sandaracinus TaxID=3045177 RepID=A0ABT6WVP5_9ACTN|nr:adhesin [Actinoplanes sandaracinus]MDI6103813.1 adhesin [Actinoplanes sandaracinus]
MRATVGPLPPAVYWRRRVVVLSAVLLGVIVLFNTCSGGDEPDPKKTSSQASQNPAPAPKNPSASPSPSLEDSAPPKGGDPYPDPADLLSRPPGDGEALPPPATSAPANVPAAGQGCTDAELNLTPVPTDTSPRRGVPTDIKLKIKNVGNRTCTRDLGASAQELYIVAAAQRIWSSDQCAGLKGNNVVTLAPGAEQLFEVTWNGKQSNQCTGTAASGPVPPAGAYQLFGRLDQMISTPVVLTVVA